MTVNEYVVRCRGLPWSCTEKEINTFFEDVASSIADVQFCVNRDGRPSGEAFVTFSDDQAQQEALTKDKQNIGNRYIEVFASTASERDRVTESAGQNSRSGYGNDDGVVRMRGLPFDTRPADVREFFKGLAFDDERCVLMEEGGRPTGEAYVQFTNSGDVDAALAKHMQYIQRRYVEVFRSSADEMNRAYRRMHGAADTAGGWGGPGAGGRGGGGRGGGRTAYDDYESYGAPPSRARPTPYDRPMGGPRGLFGPGEPPVARAPFAGPGGYGAGAYGGAGAGPAAIGGAAVAAYGADDYGDYGADAGYGAAYAGPAAGGGGGYGGGYGYSAGGGPMRGGRGGGAGSGWGSGGGGGAPGRPGAHAVKMRGIPFQSKEYDIVQFFKPLEIASINILKDGTGRPSGEAQVDFYTHNDAVEAMKRDRENMGSRYVELFLESRNSGPGAGPASGRGYGGGGGGW